MANGELVEKNGVYDALTYYQSKEKLLTDMHKLAGKPCTFLVDYEFAGKSYTGEEVIDTILTLNNPHNRIFLVTSRSSEKRIQEYCLSKAIYMIPKLFALDIPLHWLTASPKRVIVAQAVMQHDVEDTESSDILFYKNLNDLLSSVEILDSACSIYIQRTLLHDGGLEKVRASGFNPKVFDNRNELLTLLTSKALAT